MGWAFFAAKIALLLPIVFFGELDLAAMTGVKIHAGQIHCVLIGNAAALRWALIDHRRRCPECLRLLARPARIGRISKTFLGCRPATRLSRFCKREWGGGPWETAYVIATG